MNAAVAPSIDGNTTPKTEISTYHDAHESQPAGPPPVHPHSQLADQGRPMQPQSQGKGPALPQRGGTISSSHSNRTAAPQYDGHAPANGTAYPIDHKAPLVDTKTATYGNERVTSPTVITPPPDSKGSGATTMSAEQERHARSATAESSMTAKQREKLNKGELREAKQMSKMAEREQRESDTSMRVLINELSKLQSVEKSAMRAQSKAESKHAKAVKQEHKTNLKYLTALGKHEKAIAELKSRVESLAAKKEHAAKQTALLAGKREEVEEKRARKAVEDRERQAKIQALAVNPTGPA